MSTTCGGLCWSYAALRRLTGIHFYRDAMTDVSRKKGKQSAEVAELTKAEIIAAATHLFSTKGFEATGLREIADQSGMTHGTIRHHFGSKLDIWKAVADQVFARYQERLIPALMDATQSEHPLAAFKNVARAFITVSNENPTFARLLTREGTSHNERYEYFDAHFVQIHVLIEVLFKKAQKESTKLQSFTNDSFFMTLISLTFFPLVLTELRRSLPAAELDDFSGREELILKVLFSE